MVRYLQGSDGVFSYAIEASAYTAETTLDQYFGFIREDVDPPNPNPQTPMATSGERRGPHANSPDPKEYGWDLPANPIDEKFPFEIALGSRTTTQVDPDATAGTGDEYQKDLISEANRLPTATVGHWQSDGTNPVLEAVYSGCKASLGLSANQGEPVSATLSLMAAGLEPTTAVSGTPASPPNLGIPQESPYRFWMLEDIEMDLSSDGTNAYTLGTANSLDANWDNGLEANNHGKGREAHSVSESTAEEKYDMTVGATITDMELYERAYHDKEPVDVEAVFNKNPGSSAARSDLRDALYVRLLGCKVVDAPSPVPGEGKLEADIGLQPRNTEIEIHTPA